MDKKDKIFTESPSAATNHLLLIAESFYDFLRRSKDNMIESTISEYLVYFLKKKKIRRSYIIKETNYNSSYIYEIFNGKKHPSRDTLIAIAIAMRLDEEEMQRALKIAGYSELYTRKKRDAAILYAVRHGYDIDKTDRLLYEHGLPPVMHD